VADGANKCNPRLASQTLNTLNPQLQMKMQLLQVHQMFFRSRPAIVALALLLLVAGCGKQGIETVPVHGIVTVDGGPAPESGGLVTYTPVDIPDGLPMRPAIGEFFQNGRFKVTSFRKGDGLVPGTYRVLVEAWIEPPQNMTNQGKKVSLSPPNLTIERGTRGTVEVAYDILTE